MQRIKTRHLVRVNQYRCNNFWLAVWHRLVHPRCWLHFSACSCTVHKRCTIHCSSRAVQLFSFPSCVSHPIIFPRCSSPLFRIYESWPVCSINTCRIGLMKLAIIRTGRIRTEEYECLSSSAWKRTPRRQIASKPR